DLASLPLKPLAAALLKTAELSVNDYAALIEARSAAGRAGSNVREYFDTMPMLDAAENLRQCVGMENALRHAIEALKSEREGYYPNREEQKLNHRIEDMLGTAPADRKDLLEAGEPWAEAAIAAQKKSPKWDALLTYCKTSEASKPSGKWLKEAKKLI